MPVRLSGPFDSISVSLVSSGSVTLSVGGTAQTRGTVVLTLIAPEVSEIDVDADALTFNGDLMTFDTDALTFVAA